MHRADVPEDVRTPTVPVRDLHDEGAFGCYVAQLAVSTGYLVRLPQAEQATDCEAT